MFCDGGLFFTSFFSGDLDGFDFLASYHSKAPPCFAAGDCFLLPFLAAIWTVSASQLPIISRLLRFFASGVHFLLPFLAAIRAVLLPRKELKNRQP